MVLGSCKGLAISKCTAAVCCTVMCLESESDSMSRTAFVWLIRILSPRLKADARIPNVGASLKLTFVACGNSFDVNTVSG